MQSCPPALLVCGLLLALVLAAPATAGTPPNIRWQAVLGSEAAEFANSINQTTDGGYIVIGDIRSYGGGGSTGSGYTSPYSGSGPTPAYGGGVTPTGTYSWQSAGAGRYTIVAVGSTGSAITATGTATSGSENQDILVMKLDSAGNLQWQRIFGGPGEESGKAVEQTTDGGYIMTGYTTAGSNRDLWVAKLDSAGDLQWQKVLGGYEEDAGSDVYQTSDGGYILIGYARSSNSGDAGPNHGDRDVWVVRLSSAGSLLWQRQYGGSGEDRGFSIRQTRDGGYIFTGSTGSGNSGDVGSHPYGDTGWVVKLNSGGAMEWQKVIGGAGYAIRQTGDGGYVLFARSGSNVPLIPGHDMIEYFVVKLDSGGSVEWQKVLGGIGVDNGMAIEQTSDGGYIMTGYSTSNNTGDVGPSHDSCDAWVVRLDSSGNILWQRQFGGSGVEWGMDIEQTGDGGYILTGHTESSNSGDVGSNHGRYDFWVVRLEPDSSSWLPTLPATTTRIPSVGEKSSSYTVGFDGLRYNADGKNTLDLDLAASRRSRATVAVYRDRVEILQRAPDGVVITFLGSTFAVEGDRVSGPVTQAFLITEPVEAPLNPGIVAGSVRTVLPELSRTGHLTTTISDRAGTTLAERSRGLLAAAGIAEADLAYTYEVRKISMPLPANASVNLTLPEAYLREHGGIAAVRVIRSGDETGALELLPVTYAGTDSRGMVHFEAVSLNGTSVFGLFTLKATRMAQENNPSLSVNPMQAPAIATLAGMMGWLAESVARNPGGAIALVACAGAAYAGRRRGMW